MTQRLIAGDFASGRSKLTPEQSMKIRELRATGTKAADLAAQFNVSLSTVYAHLNVRKPLRPAPRRLTPAEVESIRSRRDAGVPVKDISAEFGLSRDAIWYQTKRVEPKLAAATRDELLLSAYPWAHTLTTGEREQFAAELAHPPRFAKEMDITRMIWRWRVKAERRTA